MIVAYAGAPGAFGHEACLAFVPGHRAVPRDSFEQVIATVESGEVELGVVPLSNNEAGETGARELIARARVRVIEEHQLPVRMHLLGLPGSRLEDILSVASHPIALRQCARNIGRLGLATEEAANTAIAAAALDDPSHGVLASAAAARTYGLVTLAADVHDRPDNATTFAIIARDEG